MFVILARGQGTQASSTSNPLIHLLDKNPITQKLPSEIAALAQQ